MDRRFETRSEILSSSLDEPSEIRDRVFACGIVPAFRYAHAGYAFRIYHGLDYRVYFLRRGRSLIILLAGGDKRTQQKDIATALEMAGRV